MFGCTEIQVTAKVVARQLHNISQTVRSGHNTAESSRVKIIASLTDRFKRVADTGAAFVTYRRHEIRHARRRNMAEANKREARESCKKICVARRADSRETSLHSLA